MTVFSSICLVAAAYHYRPFLMPAPVWNAWPWLLLPLCLGMVIVYKSVRCKEMSQVPREAAVLFVVILMGLAAIQGLLFGLVFLSE
jgi:hypothetical protein